jgi:hypothetical protein
MAGRREATKWLESRNQGAGSRKVPECRRHFLAFARSQPNC